MTDNELLVLLTEQAVSLLEHSARQDWLLTVIAAGIWVFVGVYICRLFQVSKNQRSMMAWMLAAGLSCSTVEARDLVTRDVVTSSSIGSRLLMGFDAAHDSFTYSRINTYTSNTGAHYLLESPNVRFFVASNATNKKPGVSFWTGAGYGLSATTWNELDAPTTDFASPDATYKEFTTTVELLGGGSIRVAYYVDGVKKLQHLATGATYNETAGGYCFLRGCNGRFAEVSCWEGAMSDSEVAAVVADPAIETPGHPRIVLYSCDSWTETTTGYKDLYNWIQPRGQVESVWQALGVVTSATAPALHPYTAVATPSYDFDVPSSIDIDTGETEFDVVIDGDAWSAPIAVTITSPDGIECEPSEFVMYAGDVVSIDVTGNGFGSIEIDGDSGSWDALNGFAEIAVTGGHLDTDDDGIYDETDTDDDGDGTPDAYDVFPLDPAEHADADEDGTGNNADTDDDNDGTPDTEDDFPFDDTETNDNDGDGQGDNADPDDDNDGIFDGDDAQPNNPSVPGGTLGLSAGCAFADNPGTERIVCMSINPRRGSAPIGVTITVEVLNAAIGEEHDGVITYLSSSAGSGVLYSGAFPISISMTLPVAGVYTFTAQAYSVEGDYETAEVNGVYGGAGGSGEVELPILTGWSGGGADCDGDDVQDYVDTDDDNDGVPDSTDAFDCDPDEWQDTDGDGTGNNADTDDDGDGTADGDDAFPLDPTEDTDTDGDGIGDNSDPFDDSAANDCDEDDIPNSEETDDDNDGTPDGDDAFPCNGDEDTDTDGDGVGDNADTDDDGDGTPDGEDDFPEDEDEDTDTDDDGLGDGADQDDDGDGVSDNIDLWPADPSECCDSDGDGEGDNADDDDNNNGVPDDDDNQLGLLPCACNGVRQYRYSVDIGSENPQTWSWKLISEEGVCGCNSASGQPCCWEYDELKCPVGAGQERTVVCGYSCGQTFVKDPDCNSPDDDENEQYSDYLWRRIVGIQCGSCEEGKRPQAFGIIPYSDVPCFDQHILKHEECLTWDPDGDETPWRFDPHEIWILGSEDLANWSTCADSDVSEFENGILRCAAHDDFDGDGVPNITDVLPCYQWPSNGQREDAGDWDGGGEGEPSNFGPLRPMSVPERKNCYALVNAWALYTGSCCASSGNGCFDWEGRRDEFAVAMADLFGEAFDVDAIQNPSPHWQITITFYVVGTKTIDLHPAGWGLGAGTLAKFNQLLDMFKTFLVVWWGFILLKSCIADLAAI
jgi:hypothetical protein